jgi:sugar lactone lactonase YvrE
MASYSWTVIDELAGLGFPEALRWHKGRLWFSDMFRGKVISWEPGKEYSVAVSHSKGGPKMPGGMGWHKDGNLLLVDCLERKILKCKPSGEISTFCDLSDYTNYPLNDMYVSVDGTAWVGGYGFDPENQEPVASSIYKLTSDGEVTVSPPRFIFPNGCDQTNTGLVVAETFADRVSFFSENFEITKQVATPAGFGPDGLSAGPSGELFVAMAFAGSLMNLADDGSFETLIELDKATENEGGPRGVFDCALSADGNLLAFSSACLDEPYSMEHDTGKVTIVRITKSQGSSN